MGKYKIYHIPGVKIGVSMRLRERLRDQGYTLDDAEVIEEHDDIDFVSVREKQLQSKYGYGADSSTYLKSVQNSRKGDRSEIARKGWDKRDLEDCKSNISKSLSKLYQSNPSSIGRGETHSQARLSKDDVLKIRALALTNQYTYQQIADMFDISQQHCTNIIIRKRWKHI